MTTTDNDTALEASAHSDALECFDTPNFRSSLTEDGSIQYMPAGLHTITPSQNGRAVTVTVLVDAASADTMEEERQALVARGKSPYFSITHEDDVAAFRPNRFSWATRPDASGKLSEGVWADGEWTASGKAARDGKDFKYFSPTFFVSNVQDNPATIVCNAMAGACMGSVVNDPAFDKISPLFAKDAGTDTLEAGGQGSGRKPSSYDNAKDAAAQADLDADTATEAAERKGTAELHQTAAAAHKTAISKNVVAARLGTDDATKQKHRDLVSFHSDLSSYHSGCATAATDSPQPEAQAADAAGEHAYLMSVGFFADAHNAAVEASAKTSAALAASGSYYSLAATFAAEERAWAEVASMACRNGFAAAGAEYLQRQSTAGSNAEVYGLVAKGGGRPR
jgi:hypothetical protein